MKKAINCGKLFDSMNEKVLEKRTILIDGERVENVINTHEFSSVGYEVIDLSDKFVMFGIIYRYFNQENNPPRNPLRFNVQINISDMTLLVILIIIN